MDPKVPPHDDAAEQSVLGAILIDKDAMIEVAEFLRPEHFYKDGHAAIFGAMISLYEAHEPLDIVSVTAQLKRRHAQDRRRRRCRVGLIEFGAHKRPRREICPHYSGKLYEAAAGRTRGADN